MTRQTEADQFDALLERYMLHFQDSPDMMRLGTTYAEKIDTLQTALDTDTPIIETRDDILT